MNLEDVIFDPESTEQYFAAQRTHKWDLLLRPLVEDAEITNHENGTKEPIRLQF